MSNTDLTMKLRYYKEDHVLVQKAVDADADAMRQIVERHQDHIYRLVYRLVSDVDVAQDITQSTFLKAFENMHRIRNGQMLYSWLYRTATNLVKDRWKLKKKTVPYDTMAPFLSDKEADPTVRVENREIEKRIQIALMALPIKYREAFVLKYVEEMDYQTLSDVMGIGVSAAKLRVHRACKSLQTLLPEFDPHRRRK